MSIAEFWVAGPYMIASNGGDHLFTSDNLRQFWEHVDTNSGVDVSNKAGCYVFAMRAGRGILPWYVGKSFGALCNEVFAPDKERKYWRVLNKYARGTPVWYLIPEGRSRGKVNRRQILALERELIRRAEMRNTKLLNVHGRHKESWAIHGYDCSCLGKKPTAANSFSGMLHG